METRVCTKCGIEKSVEEFYSNPKSRCKECEKLRKAEKVKTSCCVCGGEFLVTKRHYSKGNNYCIHCRQPKNFNDFGQLLNTSKRRARKTKKEFSLTQEGITKLWESQEGKCALTGILMRRKTSASNDFNLLNTSIDRIDPNVGYTAENVQLVCLGINYLKNRATNTQAEQFIVLLRSADGL